MNQLKSLCIKLGIPSSGTKHILQNRINEHLETVKVRNTNNPKKTILSIDVGIKNFSYCILQYNVQRLDKEIKDWKCIDFLTNPTQKYDPVEFASASIRFKNQIYKEYQPTDIVIEEQSWRSSARIPHSILKVRVIESSILL
jgi:hypothetical protein